MKKFACFSCLFFICFTSIVASRVRGTVLTFEQIMEKASGDVKVVDVFVGEFYSIHAWPPENGVHYLLADVDSSGTEGKVFFAFPESSDSDVKQLSRNRVCFKASYRIRGDLRSPGYPVLEFVELFE